MPGCCSKHTCRKLANLQCPPCRDASASAHSTAARSTSWTAGSIAGCRSRSSSSVSSASSAKPSGASSPSRSSCNEHVPKTFGPGPEWSSCLSSTQCPRKMYSTTALRTDKLHDPLRPRTLPPVEYRLHVCYNDSVDLIQPAYRHPEAPQQALGWSDEQHRHRPGPCPASHPQARRLHHSKNMPELLTGAPMRHAGCRAMCIQTPACSSLWPHHLGSIVKPTACR